MPPESDIDELVAAGRLAEAAQRLEDAGQHLKAAELYEQLWDFAAAARASQASGDFPRALHNLLQARNPAALEELIADLLRANPLVALECASACEERGAWFHAARLFEAGSEVARAAQCFEHAGLLVDAARCHEAAGDLRAAMDVYRRHLAQLDEQQLEGARYDQEVASSSFALGRLLLKFGREEEALPPLQRAWRLDRVGPAGRAVVAALCRLGYTSGADFALKLIRQRLPPETGDRLTLRLCLDDPAFVPSSTETGPDARILAGRYRLGKLLGSGGMGRVYEAIDRLSDQRVAVKVFTAPGGARGRDAYRRFVKEARTTGQLHHSHIVSLLDFHEEMGFMVLEYMAGGTLADRLRPALDVPTSRAVMLQVLAGLAAAHQRGIVHRDIKPSNIFFTEAGAAKLGDFGVAHLQDAGQTQTGAFIGTLAFMSPEQIKGEPVTYATDIYALGVTLFQMLTGQLPFSQPDLISKHLSAPPPSPSSVVPELPDLCNEIVLCCLSKDPTDRFESLESIRQAVERLPLQLGQVRPVGHEEEPRPATQERQRRSIDRRFTVESVLQDSGPVQALEAQDNQLGRSVVLIRIAPGGARGQLLSLLRTAAAGGGPHLQRVLSLDPDRGQAVLQTPFGDPLALPPSDPHAAVMLARLLGVALAPLHKAGLAHGAVGPEAITRSGETLVLSLIPALVDRGQPRIEDDVRAVLGMLGLIAEPEPGNGADLAAWAEEQRHQLEERSRRSRQRSMLRSALPSAPPGVRRE